MNTVGKLEQPMTPDEIERTGVRLLNDMPASIREQLEISRKELLNLGLRNPLLNHRFLKARGAQIINERSVELFRLLVRDGKKMSFLASAKTGEEEAQEEQTVLWELEELTDEEQEAAYRDLNLQTAHAAPQLQSRLLNTYRLARSFLDEQGVNTLFLALGMLSWYEADSSREKLKAPLILIPVELERASARDKFQLRFTGEEIGTNLSLAAKLEAEFGIRDFPEIGELDDFDVPTYFDAVGRAISGMEGWEVERDTIALGFFSYGKFLMFRDLGEEAWGNGDPLCHHPVIKALFQSGFHEMKLPIGDEEHLDRHLRPLAVEQVVDADSSQLRALWSVSKGWNLVIQGPPGCGKSQTITNLIADAIGKGKKVLFVAEKKAALDVVMRRLEAAGLGDACLEMHGQNTNKKGLLAELKRTLSQGMPDLGPNQEQVTQLEELRHRLNEYCEAVNLPIGNSAVTPYVAYGRLLDIRQRCAGERLPLLPLPRLTEWTEGDYQRKHALIRETQARLATIGLPHQHPFYGSQVKLVMPSDQERLEESCLSAWQATARLRRAASTLAEIIQLPEAQLRLEVEVLCRAARRALEAPRLEGVRLRTGEWRARSDDIRNLLQAGASLSELHARYDAILIPEAWEQDLIETRQHLVSYGRKWWRFLARDYRRARNRLAGLCDTEAPKTVAQKIELVEAMLQARRHLTVVRQHQELGRTLFGAQWREERSDWPVLLMLFNWILALYRDIGDGQIPEEIITFLEGDTRIDGLRERIEEVEKALAVHHQRTRQVIEGLQLDEDRRFGTGQRIEHLPLAKQEQLLSQWKENLPRWPEMATWQAQREAILKEGLHDLLPLIETWEQSPPCLTLAFERTWHEKLLEQATTERPALLAFSSDTHGKAVEEFRKLDQEVLRHNRIRLARLHWDKLPRHQAGGQLGVLRREMEKRARHLSIRKLMQSAGNAVQAIKPVFMMSPLSIANFIPPGSLNFDLVIFDEASQVRPVDALGAIVRGRQLVVVGDSKQMPPTSFFDTLIQGDDEDEGNLTQDLESILGFCVAQGMPQQLLRWHYRSRHESLIAVSNCEFYDNRLIIFPSPDHERGETGLVFRHLPHTVYDRGKSQTNPQEAAAIAQAVMQFAREQLRLPCEQQLTLLVAAFSMAQKKAIEDRLDMLRRQDSSCEEFFADWFERFEVKNLETVQGDERDVIFISIGYGKDEHGRLTMNFGPLNREGGERRLNVLISRARRRCEVFTNITEEDIDLGGTNSRGVAVLKSFLAYARTGKLNIPEDGPGRGTDSPFEDQVKSALEARGYEVRTQVGCAGFFIDLAVQDPKSPGRYVIGIECDGATYHWSRAARDRDRLRQQILEGLGWRIYRIWSTDWFKYPERETEQLIRAVEEARATAARPPAVSQRESQPVEIQRIKNSMSAAPATIQAEPYQVWEKSLDLRGAEFHQLHASLLAPWLADVVERESPVHLAEVARRLNNGAGLNRVGSRIKAVIESACRYAVNMGAVVQRGDFLWTKQSRPVQVRDRRNLPASSQKIELIAPEEMALAIEQTVQASLGISRQEVPVNVLRLFGFVRTSEDQKMIVDLAIESLIARGVLSQQDEHLSLNHENGASNILPLRQ
jgi:very-short-patch-repair endonuclease